jgi:hypothetical protein
VYGTPVWRKRPREEPAHVAVRLTQLSELLQRLAVDEPEIACIWRDLDVGEPAEHAVEEPGHGSAQERLAPAVASNGVDDLVALAPARDQLRRDLRRILRSPSSTIVASPVARSRPAVTATWWPKFRVKVTTLKRWSRLWSSSELVASRRRSVVHEDHSASPSSPSSTPSRRRASWGASPPLVVERDDERVPRHEPMVEDRYRRV